MSALAKPLIHTVNSDVAVSATVNAENVHAISTTNAPKIGDNGSNKFYINFVVLGTDNQPKSVSWLYSKSATAEADRDADYVLAIAACSTAL